MHLEKLTEIQKKLTTWKKNFNRKANQKREFLCFTKSSYKSMRKAQMITASDSQMKK